MVSKYMKKPHGSHFNVAKRIIGYLQGTLNYNVLYSNKNSSSISLHDYTYSYWVGETTYIRSIVGYFF